MSVPRVFISSREQELEPEREFADIVQIGRAHV